MMLQLTMIQPEILWEDPYFLLIQKPSGWIVNEASTTKDNPVVQSWLNSFDFPIAQNSEFRSGIVHRLDKETSGVLLVAKTEEMFYALQKLFKDRKVVKTYLALVHGEVNPSTGSIKTTVGRLPWNRERFGVLAGGRDSETSYKVLEYYKNDKEILSLTEFYPKTGRTHQIRIHAKYLKHPLVADRFYGGRKTSRKDLKWCPRLFLHAKKLEFIHPITNKKVSVEAPIPTDLARVLSKLEKYSKTT